MYVLLCLIHLHLLYPPYLYFTVHDLIVCCFFVCVLFGCILSLFAVVLLWLCVIQSDLSSLTMFLQLFFVLLSRVSVFLMHLVLSGCVSLPLSVLLLFIDTSPHPESWIHLPSGKSMQSESHRDRTHNLQRENEGYNARACARTHTHRMYFRLWWLALRLIWPW